MSIQNKTFCFSFVHWLYSDYICEKYSKICEKNLSGCKLENLKIQKKSQIFLPAIFCI